MFTSKSYYLPHIKTIICGTGMGGFSGDWYMQVNNRMVVKGIENLDYHAPQGLQKLWIKYKTEFSMPDSTTTTVYQFGFSEESGEIKSYVYRSTNNFSSERLEYGIGVKPECNIPKGNLIELIPQMMAEQRIIQASSPVDQRLYIGGEIIGLHLTKNGCNIFKIAEFDDYKKNETEIFINFDNSSY